MSLYDCGKSFALRPVTLVAAITASIAVTGCQVRPLYSSAPLSAAVPASAASEMASISVKPVNTRYAQQVRNNLIFGLTGGGGEPATPLYTLDLTVTELIESAALIQVTSEEDEPTAGTVTLRAAYVLTDAKTGKTVASGRRSVPASFDQPRQEFAAMRARIDAENRAAGELAEQLRLSIAQDLARR